MVKQMENIVTNHNEELNKRVYVSEIKEKFGLKQITGDEKSLERWVIAPDINRPGLELSGFKEGTELKRVVIIGNKEQHYIATLDYETQKERFGFLTDSFTPCIIITAGHKAPDALVEIANQKNFPVFEFAEKTYILTADLTSFLSEKLAQTDSIHGEMLSINGTGVLITGESGMGKSELALDLIKRGHILVADDVVEYARIHNEIVCWAPENLRKMLEVRGIGILDVTLIVGPQSYLDKTKLDFIIKLVSKEDYIKNNNNRLEPTEKSMRLFDIDVTVIEIPVTEGKSMSPIIEAAVVNHILKNRGIDTNEMFKENIRKQIASKSAGK